MPTSRKPLLLFAGVCALLAGCGGSSGDDQARTAPPRTDTVPAPAPGTQRDPRELPAGVPLRASDDADPARARVIRAWSAAMRAGDIDAANALWASPAKVQNGTPVLTLETRAAIGVFNGSLPCGSVVTSAGGAPGGFTVATFRLTDRAGSECDGAGNSARTAILVRDGRIVEWYRLPDDPNAPGLQPPPLDDVEAATV
jgi:hypothetical protein